MKTTMNYTMGFVRAFADAIDRVNSRRTRSPEAAVLVMHPVVMRSLIEEMQASGNYDELGEYKRPPYAFHGVVTVLSMDVTQPFVADIHGNLTLV